MNIIQILQSTAEYATLIPAAIMCILPVQHHCKVNKKVLLGWIVTGLAIASVVCGIIKIKFALDTNALILPLTAICMAIYFTFYKISKQKLWYVFVSVIAMFSFAGLSSYTVEAQINENGKVSDLQTYGLIAQWVIIIGFFIATIIFLPKIKWLIDDYHLENVWKYIWLVPTLITVANVLMIPQDYATVNVGRLFEIYIVVDASFLVFYVLFQFMLYTIAKAVTDKASAEQNAQMLGIQATEYSILKKYIEDTSRLRHDFRQVARTSVRLAKNNDTESLIKLLDKYNASVEDSHLQKIFCEHNALNAIVGYYYDEALQNNIKCSLSIDIPANIAVADVDICSLVGNLLDNAIQGCMTIGENERQISFKADADNGDIFVVMTNSFDGYTKKKNGKYSSTKEKGFGIGLESIKTTVNRYNGYVNFYNDRKNFYTDIMLKQNLS